MDEYVLWQIQNLVYVSECSVGVSEMRCILTIHYDDGLSLERVGGSKDERHLWSHPFEDIEKSGDDDQTLLFFKFNGEDIPRVSESESFLNSEIDLAV